MGDSVLWYGGGGRALEDLWDACDGLRNLVNCLGMRDAAVVVEEH